MPKKKSPAATHPEKDRAPPSSAPPPPSHPFMVVGIAASAGGLEAFKMLLSAMPGNTGMAFVLVPHLDPTHASLMVELLRPRANMPIQEVRDGVAVQPDTVYVIPPDRNLEIRSGALHLSKPPQLRSAATAIDLFFRSLAEDQKEMAIGIVLSGTGSHGTSGLQTIKANGGITLVQDPSEAEYDQMPISAITADAADYVLPVAQMPVTLSIYLKHRRVDHVPKPAESDVFLARVIALLYARTKYNFKDYRKNMLFRRVQRRMGLKHVEDPNTYLTMLRENADELEQLFQDFLIDVSGFYREPDAYGVLAQQIIPELIRHKANSDIPIRIWIPACASGEEAYSIAMLFYEAMDRTKRQLPFQIFATDINESALKTARLGTYPESISADVSSERLQRFFVKSGDHYQVNKRLRESVMFAIQNVISDTPFSKLDLICCRNLLIYLEPQTQQKLLGLFHFALNEGGYLFLGASETVGRLDDMFEPVSKKWRVFRRIGPTRSGRLEFPFGFQQALHTPSPAKPEVTPRVTKIGALAQELLIDVYVPACVFINRKFEILYLHGPTHQYLSMPPGEPTHDLLAMAHEGLTSRIRSLCFQVTNSQDGEAVGDANIKRNGNYVQVRVKVRKIRVPQALEGLLLVTFEDSVDKGQGDAAEVIDTTDKNPLVQQLEFELKTTREDLQSTIEELESSNEELKSSNEEMMSVNEELQSVNEELETSKEELQSLNEELNTVNTQLEEKIEELDIVSNDLNNLLNSADITTLFLDSDMRIRRFTPRTMKLLNLMPSDTGRPISDFSYKFNDEALLIDARAVLEKLAPIDKHVWTNEGICYLRRIQPYRTVDNQIEGVVVSFIDITPQIMADIELKQATEMLKDINVAIIVKELGGRITAWNHGAERIYGYTAAEALKMNALDMIPPALHKKTQSVIAQIARGKDVGTFETRRVTKHGQTIDVALTATRLTDTRGKVIGIITTERNITDRKRAQHALLSDNKDLKVRIAMQSSEGAQYATQLLQREQYLSAIVDTDPNAIVTINRLGTITSFNPAAEGMFGYTSDEAIGQDATILFPVLAKTKRGGDWLRSLMPSKTSRAMRQRETQGRRKDKTQFPMEVSISKIDHLDIYLLVSRDISVQRRLEKEVIDVSTQEQARIGHEIHDGLGQRLTALTMLATGLEKKLTGVKTTDPALLKEFVKQLREAADEAHILSRGLAPVPIDPSGLSHALKGLAETISTSSDIACRLKADRAIELNNRTQALQLFRIAQEAVNNAAKHAHARNITIELAKRNGELTLTIQDDGKGIDSGGRGSGLGIHIMQYRANIIGAAVEVHSEKGKGTTVLCTLPHLNTD